MRLFIASSLPAEVRQSIEQAATAQRLRLPPASWVRSDSYHLTYAFLDEQPASVVDPLTHRLTAALADRQSVAATIGSPGFFPSRNRPRVGWLGFEPVEPLQRIAERVRSAAAAAGMQLDGREFTPHLTLVRIRRPWTPADIESFFTGFGAFSGTPVPVGAVSIFESRLLPGGAQHSELRRIDLK